MASGKKSGGNSRLEKNVNGRRSSKLKEGPVGKFLLLCRHSPPSLSLSLLASPFPLIEVATLATPD